MDESSWVIEFPLKSRSVRSKMEFPNRLYESSLGMSNTTLMVKEALELRSIRSVGMRIVPTKSLNALTESLRALEKLEESLEASETLTKLPEAFNIADGLLTLLETLETLGF